MVFEHDAVVVLGGVPGAGKSTLLRRAVDHDEVAVVDTDLRRAAGTASRWKSVRVFHHYTALFICSMENVGITDRNSAMADRESA